MLKIINFWDSLDNTLFYSILRNIYTAINGIKDKPWDLMATLNVFATWR